MMFVSLSTMNDKEKGWEGGESSYSRLKYVYPVRWNTIHQNLTQPPWANHFVCLESSARMKFPKQEKPSRLSSQRRYMRSPTWRAVQMNGLRDIPLVIMSNPACALVHGIYLRNI